MILSSGEISELTFIAGSIAATGCHPSVIVGRTSANRIGPQGSTYGVHVPFVAMGKTPSFQGPGRRGAKSPKHSENSMGGRGHRGPNDTVSPVQLLVLAKEPIAGQVKTRLCPPFTPAEAAQIAEACLADTLTAAVASGADRVVLALEGHVGAWCPPGVDVIAQASGTLGDRLSSAWAALDGPGVQIGMDTPQVTATILDRAMARIVDRPPRPAPALVGLADDGGWWLLGLQRWCPGAFDGVPMSTAQTGVAQVERLRSLGLIVELFDQLRDVDVAADLSAVATAAPNTRVAALCRLLHR